MTDRYYKYVVSIPFVLIGIGSLGLIKEHWFAIAPALASFLFAFHNYAEAKWMEDKAII